MKCKCAFIADAVNKDRKKDVYAEASIPEATIIPMSAIFRLVTDSYRSAKLCTRTWRESIPPILRV